jgi:hypothetical protein
MWWGWARRGRPRRPPEGALWHARVGPSTVVAWGVWRTSPTGRPTGRACGPCAHLQGATWCGSSSSSCLRRPQGLQVTELAAGHV